MFSQKKGVWNSHGSKWWFNFNGDLVRWFQPIWQIGSSPQVGMKIKNVWNHHLVIYYWIEEVESLYKHHYLSKSTSFLRIGSCFSSVKLPSSKVSSKGLKQFCFWSSKQDLSWNHQFSILKTTRKPMAWLFFYAGPSTTEIKAEGVSGHDPIVDRQKNPAIASW